MALKYGNLAKTAELQHAVNPSLEEDTEAWDREESAPTSSSGHYHKILSDFVSTNAIVTDERGILAC